VDKIPPVSITLCQNAIPVENTFQSDSHECSAMRKAPYTRVLLVQRMLASEKPHVSVAIRFDILLRIAEES